MKKTGIILGIILWMIPFISKSQDLLDAVNETFTGVKSIEVKGLFCAVEINENAGSSVMIEGDLRSTRRYDNFRIKYEQDGANLKIWIDMPVISITGVLKGYLRISTPRDVLVKVENASGNISVENVGREILTLQTVSGNINISNIPCKANLKTVSGSITCNLVSGNVVATTTSGGMKIIDIKGAAKINSTSGAVNIQNVLNEVDVSSVSGKLSVSGVYANVTCKSTSGKIELKDVKGIIKTDNTSGGGTFVNVIGEINASSVSGSIKGTSVMLTGNSNFKTSSGTIDISLSNSPKTLSFNLNSSSGSLEAAGIKGEKKLEINEGAIKITGTTSSGGQRYNYK